MYWNSSLSDATEKGSKEKKEIRGRFRKDGTLSICSLASLCQSSPTTDSLGEQLQVEEAEGPRRCRLQQRAATSFLLPRQTRPWETGAGRLMSKIRGGTLKRAWREVCEPQRREAEAGCRLGFPGGIWQCWLAVCYFPWRLSGELRLFQRTCLCAHHRQTDRARPED